jgi:hypothetical protein
MISLACPDLAVTKALSFPRTRESKTSPMTHAAKIYKETLSLSVKLGRRHADKPSSNMQSPVEKRDFFVKKLFAKKAPAWCTYVLIWSLVGTVGWSLWVLQIQRREIEHLYAINQTQKVLYDAHSQWSKDNNLQILQSGGAQPGFPVYESEVTVQGNQITARTTWEGAWGQSYEISLTDLL